MFKPNRIFAPIFLHSMAINAATFNILQILQNALHLFGYPAVVLFVMIESTGIPFPGETMLLLAAFYAAIDTQLQIPIVIACAAAGAIIGDNLGYLIGRTGGKALIHKYSNRLFFLKEERIEKAEQFFARHGSKTVFIGRFVAVLRAWAAFLAGVNKMQWHIFLIYNAAGGILWATLFGLLGYYTGHIFHNNFTLVERLARNITWSLSAIIILAAIISFIIYRKRTKHNQAKLPDTSEKNNT